MTFKFIALAIIVVCVIVAISCSWFFPEAKYKNDPMKRVKILTRIKLGCFLIMLVLALICIII